MFFLKVTWGWFVPSLQYSAQTQRFLSGKKEESSSGLIQSRKPPALFMWGYLLNVAGKRKKKKKKTTAPKSKWKGICSEILLLISHMTVPMSWSPSVRSLATLFRGLGNTSLLFRLSADQLKSSVKCKGLDRGCTEKGSAASIKCQQPAHTREPASWEPPFTLSLH